LEWKDISVEELYAYLGILIYIGLHPDQLRASNLGLRRVIRGGWHALWNFIFNIALENSFVSSDYKEVGFYSLVFKIVLILICRFVCFGLTYKRHYLLEEAFKSFRSQDVANIVDITRFLSDKSA
jgi:hypothetical protein